MLLADIVSGVTKTYLYKNLARDVIEFARDNLSDIDWKRSYWLHKAGLDDYRPVSRTVGGISLFLVGAAAGGAVALALAPKKGEAFREDVKERAMDLLNISKDEVKKAIDKRVSA